MPIYGGIILCVFVLLEQLSVPTKLLDIILTLSDKNIGSSRNYSGGLKLI